MLLARVEHSNCITASRAAAAAPQQQHRSRSGIRDRRPAKPLGKHMWSQCQCQVFTHPTTHQPAGHTSHTAAVWCVRMGICGHIPYHT